eukprot:1180122-Prorocentrum_minimum.AAC.5
MPLFTACAPFRPAANAALRPADLPHTGPPGGALPAPAVPLPRPEARHLAARGSRLPQLGPCLAPSPLSCAPLQQSRRPLRSPARQNHPSCPLLHPRAAAPSPSSAPHRFASRIG